MKLSSGEWVGWLQEVGGKFLEYIDRRAAEYSKRGTGLKGKEEEEKKKVNFESQIFNTCAIRSYSPTRRDANIFYTLYLNNMRISSQSNSGKRKGRKLVLYKGIYSSARPRGV